MAGQMLVLFAVVIVLGFVLVWLGLRGRRLNRNPTCRGCGFDLTGTLPDGVTCPECGAGLKRAKAVRIGQRRRMWVVATVGLLLILLPFAGIGVTVYAVLTGADVNQYKPVGLLLWEVKNGNASTLDAAAKEFNRRRQAGALDSGATGRVVDAALDIQGDADRSWNPEWGDFIEMVNLDGDVTDEQMQRYRDQSVVLACEVRPRIRRGEPLPLKFSNEEARLSTGSVVMATALAKTTTLDGRSIELNLSVPQMNEMGMFLPFASQSAGDTPVWVGMVSGETSPWGMGFDSGQTVLVSMPDDISPGRHELQIVLTMKGVELDTDMGFNPAANHDEDRAGRTVTLTATFEVDAADGPGIEVVPPDQELQEDIIRALSPVSGYVFDSGFGSRQVHVSLQGRNTPCDLAFDAFLRIEGKQLPLGQYVRAAERDSLNAGFGSAFMSDELSAVVGNVDITNAWLVLRPNPDLGLRTTDITRVYGGEIVIEDLQIQDMGDFVDEDFVVPAAPDPSEAGDTENGTGEDSGSGSALDTLGRFFLQKDKDE